MSGFPRADYARLDRYDPGRSPVAVDLSDNTNLWGAHPDALAVLRGAEVDDLARYPELYADTLREAVAERFGVPSECVTTGAGSDDVLDASWRASFAPGERVSWPAPTFSMVESFCAMNGLEAAPISWEDAEREPAALLQREPALVYVCRPNNPTGASCSLDWLEALIAARSDRPPLVIVDEAYADFAGESCVARAVELPNVLVARTMSKAYGLAGLRCGFAVGRPDVVEAIDKARGPYKVARLTSAAAAAALRDESDWLAGTVAECIQNRARLSTELNERGVDQLPSSANFILIRAPKGDALAASLALRRLGVGVRPFTEIPRLGDALRVTVGPWPMMESFLTAFDEISE
jgi:histidinol-phosphate aminotransferase